MRDLKDRIESQLGKVVDLFHEWDTNKDGRVSRQEFHRGLAELGYQVNKETVDELFRHSACRSTSIAVSARTARSPRLDSYATVTSCMHRECIVEL